MIPFVLLYVVGYAFLKKRDAYGDFVRGAGEGIHTAFAILPTLVGLMTAVGILRASGFLKWLSDILGRLFAGIGFPVQLVPLAVVRLFSASAATGFLLDIFKEFGPDSKIGIIASLMLSCTETVFYTMSVYFMAAKVTKTRYTLAGALLSVFAGIWEELESIWTAFSTPEMTTLWPPGLPPAFSLEIFYSFKDHSWQFQTVVTIS